MSELVKRLRGSTINIRLVHEAADRIEALEAARAVDLQTCADQLEQNTATMDIARARIEALEKALRDVIILTESEEVGSARDVIDVARAALAPEQDE
jgi:dTDP-4-dehydrorhamnose reductase